MRPLVSRASDGRGVVVVALVSVALALGGVLLGTRAKEYQPILPGHSEAPSEPDGAVPKARSYTELAQRPWRSGAEAGGWSADAALVSKLDGGEAARPLGRDQARAARAAHRAYDGAPPTIPHPVRQGDAAECLACHGDGMRLGDAKAPPVSHEAYASCTQCHVVERSPVPGSEGASPRFAGTTFAGLAAAPGPRALDSAPPAIPHQTYMRERCESCHGAFGREGMHTSHPERRSCVQCHAQSATLEQRGD